MDRRRCVKVLVVSTNGIFRDGITSWMVQYFSVMDKEDLEVHSIAWEGADGQAIADVELAGVTVHVLPPRKRATKAYIHALDRLLSHERFDAIHVCGNSATMALELWLARKNAVDMRIAHVRNTMCSHRVADKLLRPVFYSLVTQRFACGVDAGRYLYASLPFTVIPNGKDPAVWAFDAARRDEVRAALGLAVGQVALGHVGNFNSQKNHGFLLEVFASFRKNHPNAKLFMIGDGSLMDNVRSRAGELGLGDSAVTLGRRTDVPDLLQAMDCMLLPSLFEGLPNVVIEWQYAGLPCVIADTITSECAVTPLVSRMSLDAPASDWAALIEQKLAVAQRERDCHEAAVALNAAGYNVYEGAAMLRRLYLESRTEE